LSDEQKRVAAAAGTSNNGKGASDTSSVFGNGRSTFTDMGLAERLVRHIEGTMKMAQPTRIQSLAIPELMNGRDVMIRSQTGTGKTLAYLIPVVQQLQAITPRLSRTDGTKAIILAPTRELCIQIHTVAQTVFRAYHWIITGTVMGGEKKKSEKARLRKGLHVLIATPGRLLDHLENTTCLDASQLSFLSM
jgi:ATP-dependent RNA helicase DDX31/DBP7